MRNDVTGHGPQHPTGRTRAGHRSDPKGPLVFDTRELGRQAGSSLTRHRDVTAPTDLQVRPIRVEAGSLLALDVRLEAVVEGIFVSGTVEGEAEGECVRCLTTVRQPLLARVDELYCYPGSVTAETTDEDEVRVIEGDYLDLEPSVRDAVVLALPLTPLCRPDCPGLCAQCGRPLAELPAGHQHEMIDPRWAALADRLGADQHDRRQPQD